MEGLELGTPELVDEAKEKKELPEIIRLFRSGMEGLELGTPELADEVKGKLELPSEAKIMPEWVSGVMDDSGEQENCEVSFIKKGKDGNKITTHKVFENGQVTVSIYENDELTSCTVDGVQQDLAGRQESPAKENKEEKLPDSRMEHENGAPLTNEKTRATLPSKQGRMEKIPVKTVCTGCNNQVITSVKSAFNKYSIVWIIYSLFFWPYFLFLMCIGAFKTYTHKCPSCAKILNQFTPKLSASGRVGLIYAVCLHVFILGIFGCIYFGWISFKIKIGH